jgi:uncharacterized protein DUF1569
MKTLARQRDKDEILRRLQQLRPDSARRWGQMSAHQMVCHLSDSCRMVTGEKPVSDATGLMQRTLIKWTALYVPLAWPAGILTRPEIAQGLGGTCPVDFAADVAELVTLLEQLTTRERTFEWPPHPIFGRLSEKAWLRWGYLHGDHHLRQFGV